MSKLINKFFVSIIAMITVGIISCSNIFATEIPEKYDPTPDKVSDVRDQFWGTCWVFGGMSTMESFLIKNNLADRDIFLSPEDVLWWSNANPSGYGWSNKRRNDGGYPAMTTGYLTTVGARLEADIPYRGDPGDPDIEPEMDYYGSEYNQLPENYYTAERVYEVTDLITFTNATPDEIKTIIMEYGAVNTTYLDIRSYFNEETGAHWVPDKLDVNNNHNISVVGWDDNYSRDNFLPVDGKLPENNGAWMIKNSYGTNFGSAGGYTYLSYEDPHIFSSDEMTFMYSVAGARVPKEQKAYIIDEFGAVSKWAPYGENACYYANVFEFGDKEELSEVSFSTNAKGSDYVIYYAPALDGKPVYDKNEWTELASGLIEYSGYKTVEIDKKFQCPSGEGAIVLFLSGESIEIGTDDNLLEFGRPLFNAKIDADKSFYMTNEAFVVADIEKEGNGFNYTDQVNFCIRAFTVEADANVNAGVTDNNSIFVALMIAALGVCAICAVTYKKIEKI